MKYMDYKYSDDLLQRVYQAFKKYYKVELTKKESSKYLGSLV